MEIWQNRETQQKDTNGVLKGKFSKGRMSLSVCVYVIVCVDGC